MDNEKLEQIFKKSKEEIDKNWQGRNRLFENIKEGNKAKKENLKKLRSFAYSLMVAAIVLTGIYQYQKMNTLNKVELSIINDFENIILINDYTSNELVYDSTDTGDDELIDDDYLVDYYELL